MLSTDLSTRRWELAKHYFGLYEREVRSWSTTGAPLNRIERQALWRQAYAAARDRLQTPLESSK